MMEGKYSIPGAFGIAMLNKSLATVLFPSRSIEILMAALWCFLPTTLLKVALKFAKLPSIVDRHCFLLMGVISLQPHFEAIHVNQSLFERC